MRTRRRFADLVGRQLNLFAAENGELLAEIDAALHGYTAAGAGEAEERYGEIVDLADAAREALEELRDTYARTLDEDTADVYRADFAELARKRYPRISLELD